jgi:hypothetical protein
MSTSLGGVKNLQGQDVSQAPSINTNIFFTVDTQSPPTCQTIVSQAATSADQNVFLQSWKLRDSGTDLSLILSDLKKNLSNFYDSLVSNTNDQRANLDMSATNNSAIQTYLNKLELEQIPVLKLVDSCMRDSITPDYNELKKQKELTDESKLRLESVKDPETKVSYYEGWFPLFRPMSEPALFGIFIAAVLLLLLSIGVFLRMSGIQFSIALPTLFAGGESMDTKKYMYIGLGVGAVAGIGIYGYEKGWFGNNKQ